MHENGTNLEVIFHKKRASVGLAVAKISKLLYWLSSSNEGINLMMSSLNGKVSKTIMGGLHDPRDIAVYEEMGYVYFSEYGSSIVRINMDGTGKKTSDEGKHVSAYKEHATGLAVDKIENRLYWCDDEQYRIVSTDLDFSNARLVIQKTVYRLGEFYIIENQGNVVSPFSLAILGEKIFWTDRYRRAIYSANKRAGDKIEYVTGGLDVPKDLHVYRDEPTTGE